MAVFSLACELPASPEIRLEAPVTDLAEALSPEEELRLADGLRELRERTRAQMAVLVVAGLDGVPIDDFAEAVFRRWQGGDAARDDGALFILALGDRQSRLELGYGLEARIPDAAASEILAGARPALREGRTADAIAGVCGAISERLAPTPPDPLTPPPDKPTGYQGTAFVVALCAWLSFLWFGVLRGRAASSSRPAAALAVAAFLVGPTVLMLLTAGDPLIGLAHGLGWVVFGALGLLHARAHLAGPVRKALGLALIAFFALGLATDLAAHGLQGLGPAEDVAHHHIALGFAVALLLGLLNLGVGAPGDSDGRGAGAVTTTQAGWQTESWSSSSDSASSDSASSWDGGGGESGGGGASDSW
jgi:uncharacterized protein